MMRSSARLSLALLGIALMPAGAVLAQDVTAQPPPASYSSEELDNLVAPIALYPDPILAQVLVAATFSDQLQVAADYVREHGTAGVDDQPWDVSVRAVAHYPPVLNMMVERPDWSTALGQAYAAQSADVMTSVQHLRRMAEEQGNLASTPQQTVYVTHQYITIVPAQPRVIYVPTYDPAVIYFRHVGYLGAWPAYWSFGIGFPIGGWLTYDCDWYNYAVYYDGWMGGGWRIASRPFISLSIAYVSPRYAHVRINRAVLYRPVNFYGLRRYNAIHHAVNFERRGRDRNDGRVVRGGSGWNDGDRRGGVVGSPDGRRRGGNDGARGNEYNAGPGRAGDNRDPGGPTRGRIERGNGAPIGTPEPRRDPRQFGPTVVRPESKPNTRSFGPTVVRPDPQPKVVTPAPRSRPADRTIQPTIVRPQKVGKGEVIRATPSNRPSQRTVTPTIVRPQSRVRVQESRPSPPMVRGQGRAPEVRSRPSSARSVRPAASSAAYGKARSGSKGRGP